MLKASIQCMVERSVVYLSTLINELDMLFVLLHVPSAISSLGILCPICPKRFIVLRENDLVTNCRKE